MRTLVHLSDLHFGRIDSSLLAPLRALRPEIDTFADMPAASIGAAGSGSASGFSSSTDDETPDRVRC